MTRGIAAQAGRAPIFHPVNDLLVYQGFPDKVVQLVECNTDMAIGDFRGLQAAIKFSDSNHQKIDSVSLFGEMPLNGVLHELAGVTQ